VHDKATSFNAGDKAPDVSDAADTASATVTDLGDAAAAKADDISDATKHSTEG
jgi:hypothetical protein